MIKQGWGDEDVRAERSRCLNDLETRRKECAKTDICGESGAESAQESVTEVEIEQELSHQSLEVALAQMDESFSEMLLRKIDESRIFPVSFQKI